MYLKKVYAYGFKSFADKLNIELNLGITAIVGPNGSGKSNIVDAVKWVLGEQSLKSLRGSDNMTDVIFSGSKTREPHNRACVALIFDNSDHYLNSPFNEVEIKRILYKTGESEYFINNIKVRLKDINDLFIDSGAGSDAFNIISQNSIQDIIDSKPEARRVILENAAGVLKYKKRKEESLRKLEKTNNNINTVNLLIEELAQTVLPLKEQSEVAKRYVELKEKLKNIEISLIAKDISQMERELQQLNREIATLKTELLKLTTENSTTNSEEEKLKLELTSIDEKIAQANELLLQKTATLSRINSEKQIMIERKKYQLTEEKIDQSLFNLKEEKLNIEKKISLMTADIKYLNENKINKLKELDEQRNKTIQLKVKKSNILNESVILNKNILSLKSEREIIEFNLENDNKLPYAVKNIIHSKISGVHQNIGKLITVAPEYALAIDTAMQTSANFIVVDNLEVAKKCINHLKTNNLGRATFFPLDVIKEKQIDSLTLEKIKSVSGFISMADDLVKYEKIYTNIIKSQLGQVIVVDNLDSLNKIGKLIAYRYRIVTLSGEILHSGGSITGGNNQNNKESILLDKKRLEQLKKEYQLKEEKMLEIQHLIEKYEDELIEYDLKEEKISKDLFKYTEELVNKEKSCQELEEKLTGLQAEINGLTNFQENKIDGELENLMQNYQEKEIEKELLAKEISNLKNNRFSLFNNLNELDYKNKQNNTSYNKVQKELHEKEIKITKIEILMDNHLLTLNESYNLTYESAKDDYFLEESENEARKMINDYKKTLNDLGEVNIGSISEYERLNTRYEFLIEQKDDLTKSCESLLKIIAEMDQIMREKFNSTFLKVNQEFNLTFKKLFKGGFGTLKLTDPHDLLKTGIDIIIEPPGKKLNSLGLLSGGEKSLAAIALLFAILNVKLVPFCIFDEVEAALDETNVELFGKYLKERQNQSQFILVTHKKKTMEFADTLYGITMQESGVSKIVSVKLEN